MENGNKDQLHMNNSDETKSNHVNSNISKELLDIERKERITETRLCDVLTISSNDQRRELPGKTFKVPQSSVLSQVKKFLPQMEAANRQMKDLLKRVPASHVDIEHVSDDQEKVIEMNLALPPEADSLDIGHGLADQQQYIDMHLVSLPQDCSDTESSSDESSDSDSCLLGEVTAENFKVRAPTEKAKSSLIEEVVEDDPVRD